MTTTIFNPALPLRRALAVCLAGIFALAATGCDTVDSLDAGTATDAATADAAVAAGPDELATFNLLGPGGIISGGSSVDLDEMSAYIMNALQGKATGFAYAIARNGQLARSGKAGYALMPAEGNRLMQTTTRMEVASVTKTVTAVAVLRLLEQLNISVDAHVSPWLPQEWTRGPGFKGRNQVTFRHLLTHTSGLDQAFQALQGPDTLKWGNTWDGLAFVVANGTQPGSPYAYKNANYALFRVIIPALWKATGSHPGINQITKANAGFWYTAYVQQHLFNPIGVNAVTCTPQAAYPDARAYDVNNPATPGYQASIPLADCGGHRGLHLSALELANFMAHLRYTNLYLSDAARQQMDALRLGWNPNSNGAGDKSGKYWHGGDLYFGNGREQHACIMKFPGNIEASVILNSSETNPTTQCGILLNAYEAAK